METNLENNRCYSRIIWHTMKEVPEEDKTIILHFYNGIDVFGYMQYYNRHTDKWIEFYDNNYDILYSEDIVAWGEFEFPQDWDYNK